MANQMIPVVLSGGMGTRLWPLSRATLPKQFCDLLGESLMEKTLKRLTRFGSPWALTVKDLKILTDKTFHSLKIPTSQTIYEPFGRNTAPAIALLCRILEMRGMTDEIVGIFPADHLVLKEDAFAEAVELAQICARKGAVVTLGIQPEYPATGFGYIETSTQIFEKSSSMKAVNVQSFREKPDQATAQKFIEAKTFFWNAGIFIFKLSKMTECLKAFVPDTYERLQTLKPDLANLESIYKEIQSISIDYAVLEKLRSSLVCIPCDIGWSDLGSWDDVARFSEPPFEMQFANRAKVAAANSKRNFVFSSAPKAYGLLDVEDLIVVDTADAVLIAKKGSSQNVRQVTDQIAKVDERVAREHIFDTRPWGTYRVLCDDSDFKAKLIEVEPGHQISYQYHNKRAEHWIVVKGRGEVTLNEKVSVVKAGDSIFIEAGSHHRIKNTSSENLRFVEVQTGSYFGEDDIVRLKDDYARG